MESDFLDWLLPRIPGDARLEVPPGDDAAVLRPPGMRRTVVTTDMLTEGVDFTLGSGCPVEAVGHKALAVSLSDLAAMAARPEAAFVAVALPRRGGQSVARGLFAGMEPLARRHGAVIAGGDTNSWDGPLVVCTTAIGSVAPGRAWRRDGAQAGDLLVATGAFGGSLLGRHLDFEPRCHEALAIAERFTVHAAIDVSDGLSLDLSRMMTASGTCGILRLASVPIHSDALTSSRTDGAGRTPLDHALADGEDFELLLAMPPVAAGDLIEAAANGSVSVPVTILGEVKQGTGLLAEDADGGRRPLAPRGFMHALDG